MMHMVYDYDTHLSTIISYTRTTTTTNTTTQSSILIIIFFNKLKFNTHTYLCVCAVGTHSCTIVLHALLFYYWFQMLNDLGKCV